MAVLAYLGPGDDGFVLALLGYGLLVIVLLAGLVWWAVWYTSRLDNETVEPDPDGGIGERLPGGIDEVV